MQVTTLTAFGNFCIQLGIFSLSLSLRFMCRGMKIWFGLLFPKSTYADLVWCLEHRKVFYKIKKQTKFWKMCYSIVSIERFLEVQVWFTFNTWISRLIHLSMQSSIDMCHFISNFRRTKHTMRKRPSAKCHWNTDKWIDITYLKNFYCNFIQKTEIKLLSLSQGDGRTQRINFDTDSCNVFELYFYFVK